MIHDAHCHFFSRKFFETLVRPLSRFQNQDASRAASDELGWERPGTPEELADRWVGELDRQGVGRVALIASIPGDEDSVALAVRRHPNRFVGFFMVDPTRDGAVDRTRAALGEQGLSCVCLFPAMQRYRLDDERARRVIEAAAQHDGAAVFVHCGALSVGVRQRLGLPSPFDMRCGNPLDIQGPARDHPQTPFLIPHFGAGFLREALMVADLCPNVHLDTSSSNGWVRYWPGLTLAGVFQCAMEVLGPDRLIFGTDSSFFPRGWNRAVFETQRDVLQGIGISEEDRAKIFAGNFDRVFGKAR